MDGSELNPSQVAETPEAAQPGAEIPSQVAVEPIAEPAPGTEPAPKAEKVETPKIERSYTQKEWSEREAAKDKEIAEHRKSLAAQALQAEIREAQYAEAHAQTTDRQKVDAGEITTEDAQQRSQQRFQAWQQQQIWRQQQDALHHAAVAVDDGLRILAAEKMAKQYGVEAKDLLDPPFTDADKMKARAVELAWEATKAELKAAKAGGGEVFDSGQMGGGGKSEEQALREIYPTMYKK